MKILAFLKINMQRRRWYFRAAADEIAEKNMSVLRSLSIVTVGLLLCLLFLAPFVIRGWQMSIYHLAFVPAAVIYCVVVWMFSLTHSPGRISSIVMSVIFWVMVLTFIVLIDVFSNSDAPSCFMPLVCIALPASFILPMSLSFGLVGAFDLIYVIGLLWYKSDIVGQYDMFCTVCALGISAVIYYYIMLMRARDYENCMKYERLSKRDTLITTLYNKQSAQSLINSYIDENNPIESCAFIVLDVDNFKRINDTYGHHKGDLALRLVGEVLMHVFGSEDIIARFGGDEFIVFTHMCESEEKLMEKCGGICHMLKIVSEKDIGVAIECSIGAVVARGQKVDGFDGLFCQADIAMYSVKNAGKGRCAIRIYDE